MSGKDAAGNRFNARSWLWGYLFGLWAGAGIVLCIWLMGTP